MGANATTFVPTYVASEILTAADLNVTNSGIPVFADSSARDAAFGGSGEKTLAEGQYAYLESTNQTLVYDGSGWQTVGVAGLSLVQAETAFTGLTSFNVPNIFTSAYTNYLINFRWFAATVNGGINVQLSASGTAAATNYNYMRVIAYGAGSLVSARSTAQTSFAVSSQAGGSIGVYQWAQLQVSGPQLAEPTLMSVSGALQDGSAYITPDVEIFNGNHSTATAYDGLTVVAVTGTLTGTYTVYGYGKS